MTKPAWAPCHLQLNQVLGAKAGHLARNTRIGDLFPRWATISSVIIDLSVQVESATRPCG
jgi:hypothetical protein